MAIFKLLQTGSRIVGDHAMATAHCGRVNEGGEGTVKGMVVNGTAVLVVTSSRNGEAVLGAATVRGGSLHWKVTDELRAGELEGDSGLILHEGTLRRQRP